jgi:hypothetical protein
MYASACILGLSLTCIATAAFTLPSSNGFFFTTSKGTSFPCKNNVEGDIVSLRPTGCVCDLSIKKILILHFIQFLILVRASLVYDLLYKSFCNYRRIALITNLDHFSQVLDLGPFVMVCHGPELC